jgi:general stress protein YciG
MSGTVAGGKKASKKNRELYGNDFYKRIGAKGGLKSRGGGFAADHEKAREAGRKGGRISKRGKKIES